MLLFGVTGACRRGVAELLLLISWGGAKCIGCSRGVSALLLLIPWGGAKRIGCVEPLELLCGYARLVCGSSLLLTTS